MYGRVRGWFCLFLLIFNPLPPCKDHHKSHLGAPCYFGGYFDFSSTFSIFLELWRILGGFGGTLFAEVCCVCWSLLCFCLICCVFAWFAVFLLGLLCFCLICCVCWSYCVFARFDVFAEVCCVCWSSLCFGLICCVFAGFAVFFIDLLCFCLVCCVTLCFRAFGTSKSIKKGSLMLVEALGYVNEVLKTFHFPKIRTFFHHFFLPFGENHWNPCGTLCNFGVWFWLWGKNVWILT